MALELLPERLRRRITVEDEHWVWTGYVSKRGYGKAYWRGRDDYLHRITYEICVGPIPEGMEIDHLCRVKICCYPPHLEAVPHAVNIARGEGGKHHSAKTHCPKGHEYTPENTYPNRGNPNWRACKQCALDGSRIRYANKKENEYA